MRRKFVFNITGLKHRRQKLRKDSTEAEKILWYKIRNNKLGFKFFRQYSVEGYVLDFYCPEKRLAIEVDGGYHIKRDVRVYDVHRQKWIEAYSISVIRFKNQEILNDTKSVIERINALLLS